MRYIRAFWAARDGCRRLPVSGSEDPPHLTDRNLHISRLVHEHRELDSSICRPGNCDAGLSFHELPLHFPSAYPQGRLVQFTSTRWTLRIRSKGGRDVRRLRILRIPAANLRA